MVAAEHDHLGSAVGPGPRALALEARIRHESVCLVSSQAIGSFFGPHLDAVLGTEVGPGIVAFDAFLELSTEISILGINEAT